MTELDGRIALVTGSSRGFGAAIARLFAERGAGVVVHGRDAKAVTAVTAEIEQSGGRSFAAVADLTRYDQIETMRDAIEETLGPVDVLVANAGGRRARQEPLEDIAEEDWRASIDANLTATFLTIKAFLPAMRQRRRGNIITLSSIATRRPNALSSAAYTAAKAGIEVLTKELAAQAGPDGIRVNCLVPETILTEGNHLGMPDDVAHAALFLASDQSPWVSGITVDVPAGPVHV